MNAPASGRPLDGIRVLAVEQMQAAGERRTDVAVVPDGLALERAPTSFRR